MNRTLATLALGLVVSLGVCAGCGSSRDAFDGATSTDGTGPNGSGFTDGGAGAPEDLDCKGLSQGAKSSAGCDYYVAVPDVILDGAGACFAAFLTNASNEAVSISVEYGSQTLDATKFAYLPTGTGQSLKYAPLPGGKIPPGQVAILFLNRHPGLFPTIGLSLDCPAGTTPAITTADAATHGTGIGQAFHIKTSAAVAAYDMFPYGGGQSAMTSATLLLPTTSWDTNYVAIDPYGAGPVDQPFVQIVGQQDGTQVTISPTSDIVGGTGVTPTKKGKPQTYTIGRGQVLQLTQDAPLVGSVIQSTVPVGVWGGKSALGIVSCCDDTGHQQIPPVRALGNEYVGVRYRNRYDGQEESPPWRIVGAADGTTLTWEPSLPAGAPSVLNLGQVAEWSGAGPFVVRSQDAQHPFYMAAYMTGAGAFDPNENDGRGDPEFVNVIPPGEYLPSYVFFTDPTYSETNLVLVREKGQKGFADVTLDCAGVLGGWQPVGTSGAYEYTRVDLVRHNFEPQNGCNNGRHEIHSDEPFGLTVWGWGSAETGVLGKGFYTQYVSYAYPGGASVKPINSVVIPPVVR
jgi:hypothetical protein